MTPEERKHVEDIIWNLGMGDCWCAMGIDHPMAGGHSKYCKAAAEFMQWSEVKERAARARKVLGKTGSA